MSRLRRAGDVPCRVQRLEKAEHLGKIFRTEDRERAVTDRETRPNSRYTGDVSRDGVEERTVVEGNPRSDQRRTSPRTEPRAGRLLQPQEPIAGPREPMNLYAATPELAGAHMCLIGRMASAAVALRGVVDHEIMLAWMSEVTRVSPHTQASCSCPLWSSGYPNPSEIHQSWLTLSS